MFSNKKSVCGNMFAEILVTNKGQMNVMSLKTKGDAYLAIEKFCKKDGIPNLLVADMAKEEMYGEQVRIVKRKLIKQQTNEASSGW